MKKIKNILLVMELIFLCLSIISFVAELFIWGAFLHPSDVSFLCLFAAGVINFIERLISDPNDITFETNRKEKK